VKRATVLLALAGVVACAGDRFVEQPPTKFPAYPKAQDLIRFDTGPTSQFNFFVDRSSLSVGEDGVIRYIVVAKSTGATNVVYEGMRCQTRERKVYALGQPDGTWRGIAEPEWVRIAAPPEGLYALTLFRGYFCVGGTPIRSAAEGINALQRGGSHWAKEVHEENLAP
jgi:hypothetical protein